MKILLPIFFILFICYSCDSPRDLVNPLHLTRVPKPTNLSFKYDTTKSGKTLIKLNWSCEDNGNLKNFEVSRAFLKFEGDTSQFYPIPPLVTVNSFADSTIPKLTTDSAQYFYRVNATGIDRFIGPMSDFVTIKLYKK